MSEMESAIRYICVSSFSLKGAARSRDDAAVVCILLVRLIETNSTHKRDIGAAAKVSGDGWVSVGRLARTET
jgi:hypothetical protein